MACGQSLLICSNPVHQEKFNDYFDSQDDEDSMALKTALLVIWFTFLVFDDKPVFPQATPDF